MIDPDKLLRNLRSALANGNFTLTAAAAWELDHQLSLGGPLPEDWGYRATGGPK